MANGEDEIKPQVPFAVKVVNLSDAEVTLQENKILSAAASTPISKVLVVTAEGDNPRC